MKFSCSSSLLADKLILAAQVAPTNGVIPIMENALFQIADGSLFVTATDLENNIILKMPCQSDSDIAIVLDFRLILSVLKMSDNQEVFFIVDHLNVVMKLDGSSYRFVGELANDFPKIPTLPKEFEELPMRNLVSGISYCNHAISNDDIRPMMTGLNIEIVGGQMKYVATDGSRLAVYQAVIDSDFSNNSLLPKRALSLISSMNVYETFFYATDGNMAYIKVADMVIMSKLIDAKFPDYNAIVPQIQLYKASVEVSNLKKAVQRVALFSDKVSSSISLSFSNDQLILSATSELNGDKSGEEVLSVKYAGESLTIKLNHKFLQDILKVLTSPHVDIEFSAPNKALTIRPTEAIEGEELFFLLMPLM